MANIVDVSDYIIFRCKSEGDTDLTTLKHQKLLYYVQAWHLAFFDGERAFDSDFQAWIHGPVNREIYDIYRNSKFLYSELTLEDIKNVDSLNNISDELKIHIDSILDSYARFSDTQLERMTHDEDPWIEARHGLSSNERCEKVISDETMKQYYAARLQ